MRTEHLEPIPLATLSKRASAPARQFGEMLAQNVEQLLRYQHAAAGDLLNLGLEQMRATVSATDPAQLLGQHGAVAARALETTMKRGEELTRIFTEMQARLVNWADEAFDPDAFGA